MKSKTPNCDVISLITPKIQSLLKVTKPCNLKSNIFKENIICLSGHVYLSNIILKKCFSYVIFLMCLLFTDYNTDVINEIFCIWDINCLQTNL